MKKVLNYIKKHYMPFTILAVIILTLLASLLTIGIINHYRHKIVTKKESVNLYQYIGNIKDDFLANITYEDDKITKIANSKYSIKNDILYYSEESKVIIPYDSEVVFYYRNNLTYKIPKYSILSLKDNVITLQVNGSKYNDDNFIIFDGVDNYFLPDESILTLDGEKINLSAFSYVKANRATLTYYDFQSDTLITKENVKVANLHINDADLDLMNDIVVYNKKQTIIDSNVQRYPVYKEDKNGK